MVQHFVEIPDPISNNAVRTLIQRIATDPLWTDAIFSAPGSGLGPDPDLWIRHLETDP
jgi:hypothetical protein